ncbi:MAG: hypothetical protein M3O46_20980 [Myxococcota bacterium]|nr:hypothetical protein [Myxococcota bacterium]
MDPNDGTKSFLLGMRGSALSIAAVHEGVPILGVILAFGYPDDDGDLVAWAERGGSLLRNGKSVATRLAGGSLTRASIVLVSPDADKNPEANLECCAPARFRAMPSIAYRLAPAAAGDAAATLARSDGARKDVLEWVTHGPRGDIVDLYTTLAWELICLEVGKLKVRLRDPQIVALVHAGGVGQPDGISYSAYYRPRNQASSDIILGGVDGTRTRFKRVLQVCDGALLFV